MSILEGTKLVRITKDVDKLQSPTGKTLGPYKEGQIIEVDELDGVFLISQGVAEEISMKERMKLERMKYSIVPIPENEIAISIVFGGGRVVIPSEIRKMLNIKDGDRVVWIFKRGDIIMRKVGVRLKLKPGYSSIL